MFQKYLNNFTTNEIFPEGTEIFLGVTLIRKGNEWKQKSAFAKVQGVGANYKAKKKVVPKSVSEGTDIAKSLKTTTVQEMDEEEW